MPGSDHELEAVAPAGAVEARLTLVFGQASNEPGAVHIDAVEFSRIQMTQREVPGWRDTPPLWRRLEALLFAGVFAYTTWGLAAGLVHYARATAAGQGFIADLLKPFNDGNYHDSVLAVVGLLITLLTLWELVRFFIAQAGKERAAGRARAWRRGCSGRRRSNTSPPFLPDCCSACCRG